MGILGLRKFIDSCGCTRLLPVPLNPQEEKVRSKQRRPYDESVTNEANYPPVVDHVLIDMNCIIHSCFEKGNLASMSRRELLQLVVDRVKVLVTQVVEPSRTLTFCIDGPAPVAKLQTQRLRRRKVSLIDAVERNNTSQTLSSLDITAGSLFLVELENVIAEAFKPNEGRGFLSDRCAVFLHGSTVPGEGEAKISRALSFLAGNVSEEDLEACSLHHITRYNPDDVVVVIGNDIDLVLTCIGATFYHNINVIGPSSLQLINVGEVLYRWLVSSSTVGGDASRIVPTQLPSVRVDFVFLFLLNGGDHYVGVGDVASQLWRRYRSVRSAHPNSSLISPDLSGVNIDFLVDVLSADGYTGEASHEIGLDLLKASLWALCVVVTGVCPDYQFIPPSGSPTLSHLKSAALYCKRKRKEIRLQFKDESVPLTPLETYVALMPSEAALPRSVSTTLRTPQYRSLSKKLMESNDVGQITEAAKAAVEASAALLSPTECFLRQFTSPVYLNYLPPKKRTSRYLQHRLSKKGGEVPDEAVPVVRRIHIPSYFDYTHFSYPVSSLTFKDSFAPVLNAEEESEPKERRVAVNTVALKAKKDPKAQKIEQLLDRASALRANLSQSSGEGKRKRDSEQTEKEIKRIKRRINRMQQKESKMVRQTELLDDSLPIDGSFIEMLQKFVGDPKVVKDLLSESEKGNKND